MEQFTGDVLEEIVKQKLGLTMTKLNLLKQYTIMNHLILCVLMINILEFKKYSLLFKKNKLSWKLLNCFALLSRVFLLKRIASFSSSSGSASSYGSSSSQNIFLTTSPMKHLPDAPVGTAVNAVIYKGLLLKFCIRYFIFFIMF